MADRGGTGESRPLTMIDIDRRIAQLRARCLPARSTPEDLGEPVDPRIRVDSTPGASKLVLVVDGVDVSWATVVDFEQQVGAAVLRMGGIASVGTRDDQRFKGYSRCVLENCLRWMHRQGYHTSMLYGIPSYYPKFGYAKAFPQARFSVAVRDAEDALAGEFTGVPFDPAAHLEAVLAMYRDNNAGRTGITRRHADSWRPFRKGLAWNSKAIVEVFVDTEGRPAGYTVFDERPVTANVIEAGFDTPAVFPALLRRAGEFAWEQRLEAIHFHLPQDHLFTNYCRAFGTTEQTTCSRDGGAMVRMIDCRGALDQVRQELAARTVGTGRLNLQTNQGRISIAWETGDVRVGDGLHRAPLVRLPQWALAQLLYGYREAQALAADGVLTGTRAAVDAVARLFPVRPHFHYAVDHF